MPSITTPFNIFMEKKKPNKGDSGEDDDHHLAILKSAAWAWYQHGSGSTEGKPMCEIDATRTRDHAPRPSRYKLEAMRLMKEEQYHQSMEDSSQTTPSPIRTDTSLLDDYEIESISKHLDHLIASSSKRFYGLKIFDKDHILHRSMPLHSDDHDHSDTNLMKKKQKSEKKKKFFGGYWGRNSVVCGTREDVDTRAVVRMQGSGGSRKSMSRQLGYYLA